MTAGTTTATIIPPTGSMAIVGVSTAIPLGIAQPAVVVVIVIAPVVVMVAMAITASKHVGSRPAWLRLSGHTSVSRTGAVSFLRCTMPTTVGVVAISTVG